MSRIRDPIRLRRVKLKLAAKQGSIGFIPTDPEHIHKQGWVMVNCWYCHLWQLLNKMTIEHIVNLRDGGTNKQENLVLACTDCNRKRNQREQAQRKKKRRT